MVYRLISTYANEFRREFEDVETAENFAYGIMEMDKKSNRLHPNSISEWSKGRNGRRYYLLAFGF